MQKRHSDKELYFRELAATSREFYVDYVRRHASVGSGTSVLEIGCGEGGNLLPFAEQGCRVAGIDLAAAKIEKAREIFSDAGLKADFTAGDFFAMTEPEESDKYDIIVIHDVIEHIYDKAGFVRRLTAFLKPDGIVFWGFPAWQMPFGGHQQICKSRVCSVTPFLHLLPAPLYKGVLKAFGENEKMIGELLDIKRCKTPIERFERVVRQNGLAVTDRCLWFINPHYKQKFGLRPRKLWRWVGRVPYARNFFCTACFYLTRHARPV
ncbi:class I SAM-dependent methyltransferase [Alistipes sp. OttesenSCG-928-L06]|nr:class I SAM-dependent methyltransferase [Alistipes sp. OttesenSCG-928-L06]